MIDATADLRKYVHEDPKSFDDKLALMRSLHVPKDAPQMAKETLKDLFLHIADSLVLYAKGKHTTMKPYGMQVSRSTRAFKELPSTLLALTYRMQLCTRRAGTGLVASKSGKKRRAPTSLRRGVEA